MGRSEKIGGALIKEVTAKSVLTASGIPGVDYCINPYVGCRHACRYCYASFMKRFTGHDEPWGSFVDVKINAAEVLDKQLRRVKKTGSIIISSVTDAYQPAEARYGITRQCLKALAESENALSVSILTKSPLVLRDLDILKTLAGAEVGLSVTTDDDSIRAAFEPGAPSIGLRIKALATLRENGIKTYAFIGPVLPMDPVKLARAIAPHVSSVIIDAMNYKSKTTGLYRRMGLQRWLDDGFIDGVIEKLRESLGGIEVDVC
jgi:DNA repair photolyase